MRRIIIDDEEKYSELIMLSKVNESSPIFAKRDGKLMGMLVNERSSPRTGNSWILRIGGTGGATGHHPTRKECIESCLKHKYEFYV